MTARFGPDLLNGLPPTGRRYLRHAIAPGAAVAREVRLRTHFTMYLRETASTPNELRGRQELSFEAFRWQARTRYRGLPVRVTDDYGTGRGSVRVDLLSFLPLIRASGPDVSRSARGRLAAEAVWLPSALLPGSGAVWEQLGDDVARVERVIDGDPIALTLEIDGSGRLRRLGMERFGDVGVDSWQPIPYGVEVVEEGTFDGYTIPTRLVGGWWLGSPRYDPSRAGVFRISGASFG